MLITYNSPFQRLEDRRLGKAFGNSNGGPSPGGTSSPNELLLSVSQKEGHGEVQMIIRKLPSYYPSGTTRTWEQLTCSLGFPSLWKSYSLWLFLLHDSQIQQHVENRLISLPKKKTQKLHFSTLVIIRAQQEPLQDNYLVLILIRLCPTSVLGWGD